MGYHKIHPGEDQRHSAAKKRHFPTRCRAGPLTRAPNLCLWSACLLRFGGTRVGSKRCWRKRMDTTQTIYVVWLLNCHILACAPDAAKPHGSGRMDPLGLAEVVTASWRMVPSWFCQLSWCGICCMRYSPCRAGSNRGRNLKESTRTSWVVRLQRSPTRGKQSRQSSA